MERFTLERKKTLRKRIIMEFPREKFDFLVCLWDAYVVHSLRKRLISITEIAKLTDYAKNQVYRMKQWLMEVGVLKFVEYDDKGTEKFYVLRSGIARQIFIIWPTNTLFELTEEYLDRDSILNDFNNEN
jgi:hypothetical protein